MDTAINLLTNMIGALTMARIVDDPTLSDQILETTRKRITGTFNLNAKNVKHEVAQVAA